MPNPDGSKSSQSRDFLGEGLGNLAGSFFQSMGTGGSLSRTGISVGAGANSRWGGVLDFFAEVPTLEDQMPSARGVSNAVVVLVLRDMQKVTSTAIRWIERYAKDLKANGSLLMLADVNPAVVDVMKKTGALDSVGEQNIFPATSRVLDAERQAWDAAQQWLKQQSAAGEGTGS